MAEWGPEFDAANAATLQTLPDDGPGEQHFEMPSAGAVVVDMDTAQDTDGELPVLFLVDARCLWEADGLRCSCRACDKTNGAYGILTAYPSSARKLCTGAGIPCVMIRRHAEQQGASN